MNAAQQGAQLRVSAAGCLAVARMQVVGLAELREWDRELTQQVGRLEWKVWKGVRALQSL